MEKRCNISHISDATLRDECFKDYLNCDSGELYIEYESRYENTKILREIIDEFCDLFTMPAKWRTRIVLIFDELNNNAIEHGSIKSDKNICYISLSKRSTGLFIVGYVEDTGNAQGSKNHLEMRQLQSTFRDKDFSQHHSIRGRGLFLIISQLVELLDFRPSSLGGVQVYFEKLIPLD
ncbi:ATP-binding protein [Candidatus Gracilibacteria bacterium]|nr:ATP-binding protein [Candidatus Gracilibacteria bacterium]